MAIDEVSSVHHTLSAVKLISPQLTGRLNIVQTLSSLSKTSGGRPISDTDLVKWANTTAQKGQPGVRPIRSFKDPSLTTGLFILDLLDAIRPGIVDPNLVIPVDENGEYEDRRQNGAWTSSYLSHVYGCDC